MEDEVLANAGVDVFEELFKLIYTKLLTTGNTEIFIFGFRVLGICWLIINCSLLLLTFQTSPFKLQTRMLSPPTKQLGFDTQTCKPLWFYTLAWLLWLVSNSTRASVSNHTTTLSLRQLSNSLTP